jgi:tetratricopeptide (TPR) repeat protein
MRFSTARKFRAAIVFSLLLVCSTASCRREPSLPAKASKEYNEAVRTFYVGLAALQVGDDVQADSKLAQMTQLVPAEPAGWANWGVLALRQRNYDAASERFEKARALAADSDQLNYLIGLLESSRGRQAEAIAAFRKAVQSNPNNLIATYQLAQELEKQAGQGSEAEFQHLMLQILKKQPRNLAALLELARIAAKRGDASATRDALSQISTQSASWPPEVLQQLTTAQTAASSDPGAAPTRIVFLRNVLVRVPQYRQDLSEIKPPPGEEATPFLHFIRLETPTFTPAPADTSLTFTDEAIKEFKSEGWNWIGAISLGFAGPPVVAVANSREVRLSSGASFPFPSGTSSTFRNPDAIAPVDFSYDFKTDLVLAGAGGVRLMQQNDPKTFIDVTAQAKLPPTVVNASYSGAWTGDIEADGDLDIVLGAPDRLPTVLRNNGDGSFLEIHPFEGVSGLSGFAWADLDADGDADAALIDGAGKLHVFSNQRQGQFSERSLPANFPPVRAISIADINSDGVMDLVALQTDGAIVRLSDRNEGQEWETAQIATLRDAPVQPGNDVRLRIADLDNNGGLDLLVLTTSQPAKTAGALAWLSDEKGSLKLMSDQVVGLAQAFDAVDLSGDGRLDVLEISKGEPVLGINHGTKNYHWQVVRPHASQAVGDQRINPFGVGGEMEVRSGLMLQKQPINGPLLHFGLGEQTSSDVIRIVWPNGTVRAEFEVKGDQEVVAEQRLKGSCPFLFAFNGKGIEFVKDAVPWGSAIGLRINTLGSAAIAATSEWYKISRDQLVPHDGYYDIRITAELWEVYYYDYLALMTVDHPVGTEIFVDERFVVPPARLDLTTVSTPGKIARATDDNGDDVTDLLRTIDGKTLTSFGHGQYQGLSRDHYLEIELGANAPKQGPLYLIANGSVRPTDSSLNVAITQGARWQAHGLSLEVPDGKGGWTVAQSNLGFPAGRKKTMLFNLTDVFRPGTPRRVRIRTNLEIYWDQIELAAGAPDASFKTVRLSPIFADLHYRGYSVIHRPDSGAPEIPDYNKLSGSTQVWRDLIGYYTRFGDVGELLKDIDDRYVIVAAGDEMSLRFAEQPPPPAGWVRDFVIIGDGWIKDGDYNSTFSKTVLPLPYHAKREYTTPPTTLENEWVYKQYPEDWQNYHTRFITPEVFRNSLRAPRQK